MIDDKDIVESQIFVCTIVYKVRMLDCTHCGTVVSSQQSRLFTFLYRSIPDIPGEVESVEY